jgi:HrpA-like RNA helicase
LHAGAFGIDASWLQEFAVEESDLLTIVHAYNSWQAIESHQQRRLFCQTNFISNFTMRSISELKQQLAVLLCDLGFIPVSCGPSQTG